MPGDEAEGEGGVARFADGPVRYGGLAPSVGSTSIMDWEVYYMTLTEIMRPGNRSKRACKLSNRDPWSKTQNSRNSPKKLGKSPNGKESAADTLEEGFKQGLKYSCRINEATQKESGDTQLDPVNSWHTGTVSWRSYWYIGSQRTYRYSRTPRRRKGGWKRKPLAQRHDAPD